MGTHACVYTCKQTLMKTSTVHSCAIHTQLHNTLSHIESTQDSHTNTNGHAHNIQIYNGPHTLYHVCLVKWKKYFQITKGELCSPLDTISSCLQEF